MGEFNMLKMQFTHLNGKAQQKQFGMMPPLGFFMPEI
jgi:hypothetical protein